MHRNSTLTRSRIAPKGMVILICRCKVIQHLLIIIIIIMITLTGMVITIIMMIIIIRMIKIIIITTITEMTTTIIIVVTAMTLKYRIDWKTKEIFDRMMILSLGISLSRYPQTIRIQLNLLRRN